MRALRLLPVLLVLSSLACSGDDDDTGPVDTGDEPVCTDFDGDGFCAELDDCDDTRDFVHPGAPDIPYNGYDDDCAGDGDNVDVDKDGYDAERAGGTDCNDANPEMYPGAPEECYADLDKNCDGYTSPDDCDQDGFGRRTDCNDEDPAINPDATEVWYDGVDSDCLYDSDFDQDHDGDEISWDPSWPKAEWPDDIIVWNKNEPGKFTYIKKADAQAYWVGLDCRDLDDSIGGNLREKWDNVDRNCDDVIDHLHERDAFVTFAGNAGVTDGTLGSNMVYLGDLDGDGVPEFAAGDLGFNTYSGNAYILSAGAPSGKAFEEALGTISDPDAVGGYNTFTMEPLGDLDGDGLTELGVGNFFYNAGEGAALVYRGSDMAKGGSLTLANARAILQPGGFPGAVISNLGDLDGDGVNEVGTSAGLYLTYIDGVPRTELGIYSGSRIAGGGRLGAGQAEGLITSEDNMQTDMAGGLDINGTGGNDAVFGMFGASLSESGIYTCEAGAGGRVYVQEGSDLVGGVLRDVADMDSMVGGPCAGWTVGLLDDIDQDGYAEVVIADPGTNGSVDDNPNGGTIYLVDGDSWAADGDITALADVTIRSRKGGTWMRVQHRNADHSGDGIEDLMIGAPGSLDVVHVKQEWVPATGNGELFYFDGKTLSGGGSFEDSDADARFYHRTVGVMMGMSWAVGDLDGDDVSDVLIGAPTQGVGNLFGYRSRLFSE